LKSSINKYYVSSNSAAEIAGEKDGRVGYLSGVGVAAQWRARAEAFEDL
jgi:hypothetical protein